MNDLENTNLKQYSWDAGFNHAGGYVWYISEDVTKQELERMYEIVEKSELLQYENFGSAVVEMQFYNVNIRTYLYLVVGFIFDHWGGRCQLEIKS